MFSSVDRERAGTVGIEARLDAALAALELARLRVYYDASADQLAAAAYYRDVEPSAAPRDLFEALSQLLDATHSPRLGYDPMRLVYPWVDLHPDGLLHSIYSGAVADPESFIRADAALEATRAARSLQRQATGSSAPTTEQAELLEAEPPYNCEHVVPQSWFAERAPMRGDLHHLFACESRCNSFRGNLPYHDFPDARDGIRDSCGHQGPEGFDPVAGKGPIARATLYFLLRYPGEIGDEAREVQPGNVCRVCITQEPWS